MLALTTVDLFRSTWPEHTAKRVAQAVHGSVATAKAWVAGRFTPSADTLLRMAAENTELRRELIRRLESYGYNGSNMEAHPSNASAANEQAVRGAGGPVVDTGTIKSDALRADGDRTRPALTTYKSRRRVLL